MGKNAKIIMACFEKIRIFALKCYKNQLDEFYL